MSKDSEQKDISNLQKNIAQGQKKDSSNEGLFLGRKEPKADFLTRAYNNISGNLTIARVNINNKLEKLKNLSWQKRTEDQKDQNKGTGNGPSL